MLMNKVSISKSLSSSFETWVIGVISLSIVSFLSDMDFWLVMAYWTVGSLAVLMIFVTPWGRQLEFWVASKGEAFHRRVFLSNDEDAL